MDKVMIATVAAGQPNWPFVDSVFGLKAPGEKMFRHLAGKQGVDEGHNRIIQWFLNETDYDWMLHLDSDAVVHPDTLLRLLSWDVPFVSALAFQRRPPFVPVVYQGQMEDDSGMFKRHPLLVLEWLKRYPELVKMSNAGLVADRPDDALFEVDRGGAHCCLVHRKVFEAIKYPWFVRTGSRAQAGAGSDFYFHDQAHQAGFKTYVDLSVVAGHLTGDLCIGALDFMVWSSVTDWTSRDKGE